jgi:sugar phosphate isomerase/epimerase
MNFSATQKLCTHWSLEQALVELKEAGFTHMNLTSSLTSSLLCAPRIQTRKLKELLQLHGLEVDWVHAPFMVPALYHHREEVRACAVGALCSALSIARELDARCMVVHPTNEFYPGDTSPPQCHEQLYRSLTTLVECSQHLGIQLTLENMIEVEVSEMTIALIESIEGLGWCFDVGHAHLNGTTDVLLERCGHKLQALHLHDNNGIDDEHLVPGQGTIEWNGLMQKIKATGYRGVWGLECEVGKASEPGDGSCAHTALEFIALRSA